MTNEMAELQEKNQEQVEASLGASVRTAEERPEDRHNRRYVTEAERVELRRRMEKLGGERVAQAIGSSLPSLYRMARESGRRFSATSMAQLRAYLRKGAAARPLNPLSAGQLAELRKRLEHAGQRACAADSGVTAGAMKTLLQGTNKRQTAESVLAKLRPWLAGPFRLPPNKNPKRAAQLVGRPSINGGAGGRPKRQRKFTKREFPKMPRNLRAAIATAVSTSTQLEVAKGIGLESQSAVANILRGKRVRQATIDKVRAWADRNDMRPKKVRVRFPVPLHAGEVTPAALREKATDLRAEATEMLAQAAEKEEKAGELDEAATVLEASLAAAQRTLGA